MRNLILILPLFALFFTSWANAGGKGWELGEVVNLNSFRLSSAAQEKLAEQGFVILPSQEEEIFQIYQDAKRRGESILVTSDLLLHTSHILFDYMLRSVEVEKLNKELRDLTEAMFKGSLRQYEEAKGKGVREAALANVAFFGVAARLLGLDVELPPAILPQVEGELRLISAHKGFSYSPIFDYLEDYSQYLPRGHYTRSQLFKHYFQAMMWYGRICFWLEPGKSILAGQVDAKGKGRSLTRQAILICTLLNETRGARKSWERVYRPTVFFVGKTDDLDVDDYTKLIRDVYGDRFSIDALTDTKQLDDFIKRARALRKPQIISTLVEDVEAARKGAAQITQGFRFMGQRFIPDSYILQNLVYNKVVGYTGDGHPFTMELTPMGPQRCFPRGLDVMAVLGSWCALEILKEEGDTEYRNYDQMLNSLRREFAHLDEETWEENLYWSWFSCLRWLVGRKHNGYPPFMGTKAWTLKELNTALGSWAELRHDTILYAKQSYTVGATAVLPRAKPTKGYVEPYPKLYERIRALITQLREGLSSQGLLPEGTFGKLQQFEELLSSLTTISQKELQGKTLSDEEYRLIWDIGSKLEGIIRFSPELMKKITSGTDRKMAVVADVHTDVNSQQVLEEGVGNPSIIYLIAQVEGKPTLTKGGVFSYYEFKQPMQDRLTDEGWQELLAKRQGPNPPKWANELYPR